MVCALASWLAVKVIAARASVAFCLKFMEMMGCKKGLKREKNRARFAQRAAILGAFLKINKKLFVVC